MVHHGAGPISFSAGHLESFLTYRNAVRNHLDLIVLGREIAVAVEDDGVVGGCTGIGDRLAEVHVNRNPDVVGIKVLGGAGHLRKTGLKPSFIFEKDHDNGVAFKR